MKDVFGAEIKPGSIVCYAARVGSRQELNFAIVMEIQEHRNDWRGIKIRGLEMQAVKGKVFRLKSQSYANPTQMWVIEERKALPVGVLKALEQGFEFYLAKKKTAEEKALEKRMGFKLTRSQRYALNIQKEENLFAQMRQDIANA